MESHAHPFAFLFLPWALGFFSSIIFGIVINVLFPAKMIEKSLG